MPESSARQDAFDTVFGIVLPILCLVFDPIVFRDRGLFGVGYLSSFRAFAYLAIALGAATLGLRLRARNLPEALLALACGVFLVGALLALVLGIYLLPLSLTGLLFFIGLFGFVPFLTAFVYWRNGIRTYQSVRSSTNPGLLAGTILLGALLSVGLPFAVNWQTSAVWSSRELWVPLERLWLVKAGSDPGVIHLVIDNRTDQALEPLRISDVHGLLLQTQPVGPFTVADVYIENDSWGENAISMTDSRGNTYHLIGYFESPLSGRVDLYIECIGPGGIAGQSRVLIFLQDYPWSPFGGAGCN